MIHSVNWAAIPPLIVEQPKSVNARLHSAGTFTVKLWAVPLTYQWKHNGTAIEAQLSTLTLNEIKLSDEGTTRRGQQRHRLHDECFAHFNVKRKRKQMISITTGIRTFCWSIGTYLAFC
jgi:hypothetical protein